VIVYDEVEWIREDEFLTSMTVLPLPSIARQPAKADGVVAYFVPNNNLEEDRWDEYVQVCIYFESPYGNRLTADVATNCLARQRIISVGQ
jgi:hypothetical protein